jgi:hypothetical protein
MIEPTSTAGRPPARPTGTLVFSLFLVGMLAAACSVSSGPPSSDEASDSPDSPSQPAGSPATTGPSPASSARPPETGETPIKITIADTVITARLADNPTAHDLAIQLPLTLTFRDFNEVEKIAKLPRPLSLHGAPAGAGPDIRDIGYYAPSGDLVFYYDEVGYFNGIVRIGQFDTTMDLIEQQHDSFQVTIESA